MNEREIIDLADACGRRACTTEQHHGCPYGDKGLMDCVERLEQDYEAAVKRLLELREAVQGDCRYCAHNKPENTVDGICAGCVHFAAKEMVKGDFWALADMGKEEKKHGTAYACVDQEHNTWRCEACGHLETFEADGPTENGWDLCPSCGREIVVEDEVPEGVERHRDWILKRFNRTK